MMRLPKSELRQSYLFDHTGGLPCLKEPSIGWIPGKTDRGKHLPLNEVKRCYSTLFPAPFLAGFNMPGKSSEQTLRFVLENERIYWR